MLLDAIRTRLGSLSKSERKVALAVLENPELTIAENISALARSAQVSEPTVVRFCRAIGYDGWHEFKLKLAQGLALAPRDRDEAPLPDDLASELIGKICGRSVNVLLDLRNNLDAQAVQAAIDILAAAKKIEFYGQGSSGLVAADAQHKFFRSGVPTVAYSDPHIHAISAALLQKGDAVVAISQRGGSVALLHSVRLAKDAGADIIAIAPSGTPLAALASVLLPVDLPVDTDPYRPISARLAHLTVIDILAVGLALRRGPEFRRRMQAAQRALQRIDIQFDPYTEPSSVAARKAVD